METITKEKLNTIIENSKLENKIILLKFEANWCGPCRTLSPILDEVAKEREDIQVVKVNVDENSELSQEYGIRSIPAVFLFKKGEVINKFLGLKSKEDILKLV